MAKLIFIFEGNSTCLDSILKYCRCGWNAIKEDWKRKEYTVAAELGMDTEMNIEHETDFII